MRSKQREGGGPSLPEVPRLADESGGIGHVVQHLVRGPSDSEEWCPVLRRRLRNPIALHVHREDRESMTQIPLGLWSNDRRRGEQPTNMDRKTALRRTPGGVDEARIAGIPGRTGNPIGVK
jgi:hypothetical protein